LEPKSATGSPFRNSLVFVRHSFSTIRKKQKPSSFVVFVMKLVPLSCSDQSGFEMVPLKFALLLYSNLARSRSFGCQSEGVYLYNRGSFAVLEEDEQHTGQ
jgi:hypothetical protein